MNRKLSLAFAALLVCACSTKESSAHPPSQPPVASNPAVKPAELPPVMSQDEADAKAKAAIQKENADAELEKLKKELAGG